MFVMIYTFEGEAERPNGADRLSGRMDTVHPPA